MNKLAIFLSSALISGAALSSSTVTTKPGDFVLRNADNTAIPNLLVSRFPTLSACEAVAKTLPAKNYKCDQSNLVTVSATCADEPAPRVSLEKKSIDGQEYWAIPEDGLLLPPPPSPDNDWATMIYVYVKNPKGDAGYPACWIRGWAREDLWRINPNYPNTPFMELIVPGQADVIEGPPDESHDCWPGQTECVPTKQG